MRFGDVLTSVFGASTTATSTGAVNSIHDSATPAGGDVYLLTMMLGEVAPGGVGSGPYGMLVLAAIAVFLAGLMVGRTSQYLGKKIGRKEVTLVALYILTMPMVRRVGAAITAPRPAGGLVGRQRVARALRDPPRLHVDLEQQRLRLRRLRARHHLSEHRARP